MLRCSLPCLECVATRSSFAKAMRDSLVACSQTLLPMQKVEVHQTVRSLSTTTGTTGTTAVVHAPSLGLWSDIVIVLLLVVAVCCLAHVWTVATKSM